MGQWCWFVLLFITDAAFLPGGGKGGGLILSNKERCLECFFCLFVVFVMVVGNWTNREMSSEEKNVEMGGATEQVEKRFING